MEDDDIVFDRDTSAPKKKLKDRKRRKGKSNKNENGANLKTVQNSSENMDENANKKGKNNVKDLQNNIISTESNVAKNKKKEISINISETDKKKNQKDDLINYKSLDSDQINPLSSYNNQTNNSNMNEAQNNSNNLNENARYLQTDVLNSKTTHNNTDLYPSEDSNNKNQLLSQENEDLNNSNSADNINSNSNSNLNENINSKNLSESEAFLKEYNDAMNSGDKDRIILVLQKKIEYLDLNINDLNLIIQHLRNDIHKKEKVLHLLTDTNTKLKKSLNAFSRQLDEKILEASKKPKMQGNKNSKSVRTIFNNKKNGGNSRNSDNLPNDEEKNYTQLDNALAMNKILQKDNDNLKNLLNTYGNIDKMKELENLNKILKEQNAALNNEMVELKREYGEHSYCEKKRNSLLEQIRYLTEENKRLKNDIKKLTTINTEDGSNSKDNGGSTARNKAKTQKIGMLKSPNLPGITTHKKTVEGENEKLLSKQKNNKDDELENLADKDEIIILINLFQGDEQKLLEFKKKMIIYAKCKESNINKHKLEEKNLNKKIYSMQEQVEYLNHKVKESEMRIKIFQQQLNDSNFQNKKLKKEYNKEKKEKEGVKQKLKDFKKKNEKMVMKKLKNDYKNMEENEKDEENVNEENEVEENEIENNEDNEN